MLRVRRITREGVLPLDAARHGPYRTLDKIFLAKRIGLPIDFLSILPPPISFFFVYRDRAFGALTPPFITGSQVFSFLCGGQGFSLEFLRSFPGLGPFVPALRPFS